MALLVFTCLLNTSALVIILSAVYSQFSINNLPFLSLWLPSFLLILIVLILVVKLLIFHVYISYKKVSTYDYIMSKKNKKKEMKIKSSANSSKKNQILPVASSILSKSSRSGRGNISTRHLNKISGKLVVVNKRDSISS